ncbi:MAG: hypothetical protein NTW42_09930 [Deltaproteobacteria bacterium]|nr:hypothetical protein [Deltaproteobacteria bacterium]
MRDSDPVAFFWPSLSRGDAHRDSSLRDEALGIAQENPCVPPELLRNGLN